MKQTCITIEHGEVEIDEEGLRTWRKEYFRKSHVVSSRGLDKGHVLHQVDILLDQMLYDISFLEKNNAKDV